MFAGSLFRNCYDKQPVPCVFDNWSDLVLFLEEESTKPSLSSKEAKERAPLISPAVYQDGTVRAKDNVLVWGNWFAVDVDNKEGLNVEADVEKVAAKCTALGLAFVIYTTTSNTAERHCFRLMFPTDRPVEAHEFYTVWHSVAAWLGCADKQTKDPSRMFTLPREWDGAVNFFHSAMGRPLCVDDIVTRFPPTPVERHAMRLATSMSIEAADLMPVCPTMVSLNGPFVSDAAMLKATTGQKGGRMYAFLCSVGTRALIKGYAISAADLADIGDELARSMGRHRDDIEHDANNALRAAHRSYEEWKATQFTRLYKPLPDIFLRNRNTQP